jgi:thiopurine S-methyltransferase
MDESFWQQRWAQGHTGWHQEEVDRLLQKHWPALQLAAGSRVLVPLCGMSLDMDWLQARGHRVLGVELARAACSGFFAAHGRTPRVVADGVFDRFQGDTIELLCGDIFALPITEFAAVDAVYDRAALIALPPAMRARYAEHVYGSLPAGCRGLLITLEYPAHERSGPPFCVPEGEVRSLLEPAWTIELAERRDILAAEPRFRDEGVSALCTTVYCLLRR